MAQRELSHLIVGIFDDAESGRVALQSLYDLSLALRRRAICIIRDVQDVVLLEVGDDEPKSPILTLISTAIAGGVLTHESGLLGDESDLNADDIIRLAVELEYGRAAVVVVVSALEADAVIVLFTRLGAKSELHMLANGAENSAAPYRSPKSGR